MNSSLPILLCEILGAKYSEDHELPSLSFKQAKTSSNIVQAVQGRKRAYVVEHARKSATLYLSSGYVIVLSVS
jgi:hypothetical protein